MFDQKNYYIKNKDYILNRQHIYFKKYYALNKQKINNNSLQRYYNKHGLNYNTNLNNNLLETNIIIRLTDD